jgi:hypothetical protein
MPRNFGSSIIFTDSPGVALMTVPPVLAPGDPDADSLAAGDPDADSLAAGDPDAASLAATLAAVVAAAVASAVAAAVVATGVARGADVAALDGAADDPPDEHAVASTAALTNSPANLNDVECIWLLLDPRYRSQRGGGLNGSAPPSG